MARAYDLSFSMSASLALHAGVLLVAALGAVPLEEAAAETASTELASLRFPYLVATADLDPPEDTPPPLAADPDPDGRARSQSRCDEVLGGSMGEPIAAQAPRRYGVAGPADNADPHLAREAYPAADFTPVSVAGPPSAPQGGDAEAPVAPWARDDVLGTDPESARGHLWGEAYGEAFGSPGAGLGRKVLCPRCGDRGGGVRGAVLLAGLAVGTEKATAPAGVTVAESARWVRARR